MRDEVSWNIGLRVANLPCEAKVGAPALKSDADQRGSARLRREAGQFAIGVVGMDEAVSTPIAPAVIDFAANL